MELIVNGNINASNVQTGDINTMTITTERGKEILQEKDWKELEEFFNERLVELVKDEDLYVLTNKGLSYVKKKDEKGFKGFLARNRENFFSNILSNMASSGMLMLLSELVS